MLLKLGTVNNFRTAQAHSFAHGNYHKVGPICARVCKCISVKWGFLGLKSPPTEPLV